MTRRELAKHLSKDVTHKGPHYQLGSTVWQTDDDDWGAIPGLHRPPLSAAWYEHIGWDQVAERNSVLKVERELQYYERKFTGRLRRIDLKSLRRRA